MIEFKLKIQSQSEMLRPIQKIINKLNLPVSERFFV